MWKHQGGLVQRGKGIKKAFHSPGRLWPPPCFQVVHLFEMTSVRKNEKGLGVTGNRGEDPNRTRKLTVARACFLILSHGRQEVSTARWWAKIRGVTLKSVHISLLSAEF